MFLQSPKGYALTLMGGSLGLVLPLPEVLFDINGLLNITKKVMYGGEVNFMQEIQGLGYGGITGYSQQSYSYMSTNSAGATTVVNTQAWKIDLGGASPASNQKGQIQVIQSEENGVYTDLTISIYGADNSATAMISESIFHDQVYDRWIQNNKTAWTDSNISFHENTHYMSQKDGNWSFSTDVGFVGVQDTTIGLPQIF